MSENLPTICPTRQRHFAHTLCSFAQPNINHHIPKKLNATPIYIRMYVYVLQFQSKAEQQKRKKKLKLTSAEIMVSLTNVALRTLLT